MAVFKSFELNGNKQSFANWISNLSPCETPFTSMIGKEGINQAVYSWQTDRLAPAITTPGIVEGSEAVAEARESTSVIHNYTSILRKVVSVADTVDKINLHGRANETNYQMSKAGKEIMRDLEYMNLQRVNGRPGTPTAHSQFAGFEGLVGGLNVADGDTGAVVHKEIEVVDGTFSCLEQRDIFDMTYNLFLSGSKADKIMFHPKHAPAFAAFINDTSATPRTYRMFDGMDDKYNVQVKTLKDPLGRIYTLIPNRFMLEDKIYFFTESDWTQMILRSPEVSKLGKKGSSTQYLMEMEVGLRHKHPYASGVLTLKNVTVHNEFFPAKRLFTAGINETYDVHCQTLVDGTHEKGLPVYFYSSNPAVLSCEKDEVLTDITGKVENKFVIGNYTGTTQVWTVFKGVKSQVHEITVRAPDIEFEVSNPNPVTGEKVELTAKVRDANLDLIGDGITVRWYTDPSNLIELASITSPTVAGIATVEATILGDGQILTQALVNSFVSGVRFLNYVPKAAYVEDPVVTPDTFMVGSTADVIADVLDDEGQAIQGALVTWTISPVGIATLSEMSSLTDHNGVASVNIEGNARGVGKITASIEGFRSTATSFYVGTGARMTFNIDPNPATVGAPLKFTVTLVGQDGSPLRDVPVTFSADPAVAPEIPGGSTDVNGIYEVEITPVSSVDTAVTAIVAGFNLRETIDLTFN